MKAVPNENNEMNMISIPLRIKSTPEFYSLLLITMINNYLIYGNLFGIKLNRIGRKSNSRVTRHIENNILTYVASPIEVSDVY